MKISVFEVHKNHPVFSRLCHDERVLEIVRFLLVSVFV